MTVRWFVWSLLLLATVGAWGGCRGEKKVIYPTTVVVETQPENGAAVLINGQPYGETPVTAKGIPPGPTLIEVTKEGYKDAYETVRIPDQGESRFALEMEPLVGYLTIFSTPDNAQVYIDGDQFVGVTPLTNLKIPSGERTLTLKKDTYVPFQTMLKVETDYRYTKSYTLKAMDGTLEVYSTPTSANLWVNNQLQEEKTPVRLTLAPGNYTVSVHARGYIMAEEVVDIAPADHRTVDLKMKEGAAPPGMVLVPGGEFIFGEDNQSPDERPKRTVHVEAFYIDKYEVTNAQFKQVFPSHTFEKGFENYPATNVTWEQATAYASAVEKRLPTEKEWEKAARGTDGREYPWGELYDASLVNAGGDVNAKVAEVGQYPGGASPYGCLDMAGNVYEWTYDWYKAYDGNNEIKKDYGQVFKVLRGGSYRTRSYDVRCTKRHYARTYEAKADYGFRCAKTIQEEGGIPTGAPGR